MKTEEHKRLSNLRESIEMAMKSYEELKTEEGRTDKMLPAMRRHIHLQYLDPGQNHDAWRAIFLDDKEMLNRFSEPQPT